MAAPRKPSDDETPEVEETAKPARQGSARPNDLPLVEQTPALPNSTLASRAAQRAKRVKAENKRVDGGDAETK